MKRCPVCQNSYTDDTLQFCLQDGETLSIVNTEQPTEQFPGGTNPIMVNIPKDETPTIIAHKPVSPPPVEKGRSGLIIGVLVALLAIVVLGSAGIIGWLLLRDRDNKLSVENSKTPNITTPQMPTPDQTANLKEKNANLEKKTPEQKSPKPTVPIVSNTSTPQTKKITAKANSPGDGFLALRAAPSAETGDRIMKIPHGATLTVIECLPKAAGKNGRWCKVDYNGNTGWAYDGYMIYQ